MTAHAAVERRKTIAAIIPLYNGAKYINDSLLSVLHQTRPADEIIVVDDGSTDRGPELVCVLAQQHPRIQLIRKENGGQSSARNLGVARSNAKLIAFLDQDDMWRPTHLEALAEPFDSNAHLNLGWVYSDLDEVDEAGEMVTRNFLRTLDTDHPKTSLFRCLDHDMFILPSASLIARTAFESVGGFDERLLGYEDDDLFLRLFRQGFANLYIPLALSVWRIHRFSSSYSIRMARSRLVYANKLFETYLDEPERELYYARDYIAPRFFKSAVSDYMRVVRSNDKRAFGEHVRAMRFFAKRLRLSQRALLSLSMSIFASFRVARLFHHCRALSPIARTWLAISSP